MACTDNAYVWLIKEGYSYTSENGNQKADGSITLVQSKDNNIIVDTGNPHDKPVIIEGLKAHGLSTDDINFVVGTHGHSDHIGNLNLFPKATFIVSFDVCKGDLYMKNQLAEGEDFEIDENVSILPTPGHTSSDISVLVRNTELGTVIVAGDLFECEEDLQSTIIWECCSENKALQRENRDKILKIADYIIPGHGKMFRVPKSD